MNRRRRRRKRRRNDILYALIALSCAALVLIAIAIIDVVQSGDDAITVEFQNYDSPSKQVDEKTFATKGAAQVSTDSKEPVISEKPAATKKVKDIDSEFLVLINRQNPNTNKERPDDLVTMGEFFTGEVELQNPQGSINRTAALAAKQMFEDANAQGIGPYIITTAYRSYQFQEQEYQEYISNHPGEEIGKVLPASASEHTTGLAIDILSKSHYTADDYYFYTQEGQWLYNNAHKYGFILRYPKNKEEITGVIFEPWHYRYVGKEVAKEIHDQGLCLEEYLDRAS